MAAVGSKDFYVRFVIEGRRRTEALDLPLTLAVRHAQVRPSSMARSTPCDVGAACLIPRRTCDGLVVCMTEAETIGIS